ncbi:MAG: dTMP kinase [Calditrichaeota bacterium]|nr:dTMP kinase [Calditrichota bacterium]MCB9365618.1 dTMP kinase [Calditrichota bacterium]
MLISFEGIDGSGKSTQLELAREWLAGLGYDVLLTREPGGTSAGEAIRELLLNPKSHLTGRAEFLLYSASRAQLVEDVLAPHLKKPRSIALVDRFADSSTVYQGVGRMLGIEAVQEVNDFATGNLQPELTLYLDVDYETSLARRKTSGGAPDRLEQNPREFFEAVRAAYIELCTAYPERMVRIDARESAENVFQQVRAAISSRLPN